MSNSDQESAYIQWTGEDLNEALCHKEERTVTNDNTVRYQGKSLQIPQDSQRYHYVRTEVEVRQYLDGTLGVFFGNRNIGHFDSEGNLLGALPDFRRAA